MRAASGCSRAICTSTDASAGVRRVAFTTFALRHAFTFRGAVFKKDKAYLAGLPQARLEDLARLFVSDRLLDTLYPPALARLERHRADGDLVLLLTGTPDFIARPLCERLGVANVIATECVTRNGVFTTAIPLQHPFGVDKLTLARAFADAHDVRLDHAVAYANAREDSLPAGRGRRSGCGQAGSAPARPRSPRRLGDSRSTDLGGQCTIACTTEPTSAPTKPPTAPPINAARAT